MIAPTRLSHRVKEIDRFEGVLAEGVITKEDLRGPLAGQELGALITEIQNGGAYVNVHTNDFVDPPNTGPGDFPEWYNQCPDGCNCSNIGRICAK